MKLGFYLMGIFVLLANSFVLYVSFLHAYFFNDYLFSVHINSFGEAHIELVLLTFILAISFVSSIKIITHLTAHPKNIP
jgi:hypothetical protein